MCTQTTTIADMQTGDLCKILGFKEMQDSFVRLQEMGLTPGTTIEVVRQAPMGGALDIKVRGMRLSIGLEEANLIEVEGCS